MTGKEQGKTISTDFNQHILNIVTPAGIDYDDTHASVGENYGSVLTISRYPVDGVDYGWLASLCNLESSMTVIEYRYVDSAKVVAALNKKLSESKSEREMKKDESEKQQMDQKIKSMGELIQRLAVRHEPVGYVNIMIYIQASNKKDYEDVYKRVSGKVAIAGCSLRCLKYKQMQALHCISPYGIPDRMVSNMGARPMPLSTLIGGFAMASSGINDKGGYFLGRTKEGRLLILNMWLRNKDRTNSNWVILGVPGVGKSTFIKDVLLREYGFGTKIIIFDIEKEYVDMAMNRDIQGAIVHCAGGPKGRINPLQIRNTPKITEEDLDEGESLDDYLQFDDEYGLSDMALHIQNLRSFHKMYFGAKDFTFDIKTALEECLIEAYNQKNITWDTDISKLNPEDYPIYSDVYEICEKKRQAPKLSEYQKNKYDKLLDMLYPLAKGADQFLWNGPTTVDLSADFIVFDTSKLMELDDNVKNAQLFNLQTLGWHEMSKNRDEKVMLVADEGYNYADPDYPEMMKFFRNISKRDRKYEGSLMFITHSLVDILDPVVKRLSQAIIDTACYKFLMGCDGKNLEETAELFKLTEKEIEILGAKNRGEGILFAGNTRVNARIEVPEKFLEMFGNAGGR